jgi:uncharacterized protein (TIGR00369 family)
MNEKSLGSPMEDLLNLGKQVLSSQPFSVYVGTEMLSFTQGSVELKIPIRHELKQQHGFVHGGVISYAADNALTFAGGSVLGPGVTTSEFKINYLRPAIGDFLVARASVIYSGKSQAVCRCDVFVSKDGRESLCATSQGTITMLGRSSNAKA